MPRPSSPAAAAQPDLAIPPHPLVAWRTWWPVFFLVVATTGTAAIVNTLSVLSCERADGLCTLDRGSLAFSYREEFPIVDLKNATVQDGTSAMPHRAQDGGGERIYIHTRGESFRLLDNDAWSHAEREVEVATINAFIADPTVASLEVRIDRRARVLLQGFATGAIGGALWVLQRVLAARRARQARGEDHVDTGQ